MGGYAPTPLELVIVGAGPAGLAAANAAASLRPVVLDSGPSLDEREGRERADILRGVGGAGLYSDGKFSFWPSASALWTLERARLRDAYVWLQDITRDMEIAVPPFPRDVAQAGPVGSEKKYPSLYGSLEMRKRLIRRLSSDVDIRTSTDVRAVEKLVNGWRVDTLGGSVRTARIIFAAGRFGSLLNAQSSKLLVQVPRRIEVGIRIEQTAGSFFLRDHPSVDPKYILPSDAGDIEWRTFCCCRNGQIECGSFSGITSVSGRADGPKTGLSNVGFNVRYKEPEDIGTLWPEIARRFETGAGAFKVSLVDFQAAVQTGSENAIERHYGQRIARDLSLGLSRLGKEFPPHAFADAQLVGPAIEGVGNYLAHDSQLHTAAPDAWVVGDAAGSFRGLTAALLSGYLGGTAALGREVK